MLVQGRSCSVAIDTVCLSVKSDSVAIESKVGTSGSCDSDLDSRDESKKDDESLQEVYEKIYAQWLKVCASNQASNGEIQVLRDLNAKAESKISELELLLTEKSENLNSVTTELERTQKSLRLLNNGSSKMDHLIITSKSFGDHGGIGYSSGSKTVFINSGLLDDSMNVSVKNICCNKATYCNKQICE